MDGRGFDRMLLKEFTLYTDRTGAVLVDARKTVAAGHGPSALIAVGLAVLAIAGAIIFCTHVENEGHVQISWWPGEGKRECPVGCGLVDVISLHTRSRGTQSTTNHTKTNTNITYRKPSLEYLEIMSVET